MGLNNSKSGSLVSFVHTIVFKFNFKAAIMTNFTLTIGQMTLYSVEGVAVVKNSQRTISSDSAATLTSMEHLSIFQLIVLILQPVCVNSQLAVLLTCLPKSFSKVIIRQYLRILALPNKKSLNAALKLYFVCFNVTLNK